MTTMKNISIKIHYLALIITSFMNTNDIENSRVKKHSFNEAYYRDKFEMKRTGLFQHLQRYPNDASAKEQIRFINNVLVEGKENS